MPDAGRSILFQRHQNPALAREAREMSMAFADFSYLGWITGEDDPDRAWEMYFARTQPQVRAVLDGLLATFPPEERDQAVELAGSVEAFCLPSNAVESRVFENPGDATGYLIGVSPLVIQLSAEIAWGVHMAHPYLPEALPPGWEAATLHAQESLALNISGYIRALEGIGEAPVPTGMISTAMEATARARSESRGRGPHDFYDAALTFALTHELAHIRHGDLLPAGQGRTVAPYSEGMARLLRISDEENEEIAADASTFTACFNYFIGTWFWGNERPTGILNVLKRLEWERRFRLAAWHGAQRASEACEAYYSAIAILADLTFRRGDDGTASRLITTAARLPHVQFHVQRTREEVLAPAYGPFMWSDRDVSYRKAHHSWRIHFVEALLPAMSRHQRSDSPDWLTTWKSPAELAEDSEFRSDAVAEWEEQAADRARELGPDHPDTLATRANLAHLRGEAGDVVGAVAALEQVVTDMERVLGPDDPHTFAVRHNLAWLRGKDGDAAGSAAAYAGLLADQERVFGPDHPEVLDTRYELAWARGNSGDAEGAAAAFADLCKDHERVLGSGHATTHAARQSLAHWREMAGDTAGAAEAATAARAGKEPVLSPGHPGTLGAYEARLAEQERELGPGHPGTLTTRWFLALLRGTSGDAEGAAAAYAELLNHDLGPLGFDADRIRENLGFWQGRAAGVDVTAG
ncbi:tetratricopeptide repeat protein [Streptomyces meridianus]|uniref:Tetratricopeptide repeat protein n=1 Tax=Streptomyces meridianus TaxID=2938945 RepID=A0ABT0X5H9_9ACTN|nr:tetratricopeptide repeat protein [Streptomyces meridianus]MCM2577795.1 tetratricopeptide repeat protein [Streptomyces meridianus]